MKTMTYLLNLTLLVVCTQFAFAADENIANKQYISFEDAQAALPDKDSYDEGAYRKNNPPRDGVETSRDCENDDSSSDAYGDTCSSWYDTNESEGSYGCSGGYDTDDFSAADQCCACGGGSSSSSGPGWEDDPGAYFAAHNAAGERTALRMLEKVSAYAREVGMHSLARVAEKIVPEERFHVRLGEQVVEKYATTEERQKKLEEYFRSGLDAHWNYTEGVYRKINSMKSTEDVTA